MQKTAELSPQSITDDDFSLKELLDDSPILHDETTQLLGMADNRYLGPFSHTAEILQQQIPDRDFSLFQPVDVNNVLPGIRPAQETAEETQQPIIKVGFSFLNSGGPRAARGAKGAQQGDLRAKKGDRTSNIPYPKRISASYVRGVGTGFDYGTNYGTLDILFAPDYQVGSVLPMADIRGHMFDNSKVAGSGGLVLRYIPKNTCALFGANVYYDFRQGDIGNHFQQIGVGAEVLGKRWDFRANGYIPVGHRIGKHKCVFDDYEGGFFIEKTKKEESYTGGNAEVGYLIVNAKKENFLLYSAIGPYYLTGVCGRTTWGGKARLRPQYNDYLYLDLSVTYDGVYGAVFQSLLTLDFPIYQLTKRKKRGTSCGITERQIYQPVERFEMPMLGKCCCWDSNF